MSRPGARSRLRHPPADALKQRGAGGESPGYFFGIDGKVEPGGGVGIRRSGWRGS
jgi:hypothetical protein